MAITFRKPVGTTCGLNVVPETAGHSAPATLPSAKRANVCQSPVSMATALVIPGRTKVSLAFQMITAPSALNAE